VITVSEFPDTSHSLIARVKDQRDAASWAEFLAIYQPVVFRMARRRGLQTADAQDVIQQVFLSIAHAIDKWEAADGRPPFRAWLTIIARNAITKSFRRQRRDVSTGSSSVGELLNDLPDREATASELMREMRREIVHWAAEQIREEFSEAVWQSFYRTAVEGESIAAVATAMKRSAGSIYVARYRVIARLKEKIDEVTHNWDSGDFSHDD
jgi:RNA polymerase sigma-70 factor (ECF subfamily)